jgi:hypothetical protein
MGEVKDAHKVKLFCGIIYSGEEIKRGALDALERRFGKIDAQSETVNFDFTRYYNPEMGDNLKRFWVSFENLILPDKLAKIKIYSNSLEESFAVCSKRRVNVDPGYISPSNVVLATTKNYSHRIYLSEGIYAEVTTIYRKEGYVKLPWSYPDYMSKTAADFFIKARNILVCKERNESAAPAERLSDK